MHTVGVENNRILLSFSNIKTCKNLNRNTCELHLVRNRNTLKTSRRCRMLFQLCCANLNKVTDQQRELLGFHIPAGTLKLGVISSWNRGLFVSLTSICTPDPAWEPLFPLNLQRKKIKLTRRNENGWQMTAQVSHSTSKKSSSCDTLLSGFEGPRDHRHHGGLEAGHHTPIITWKSALRSSRLMEI